MLSFASSTRRSTPRQKLGELYPRQTFTIPCPSRHSPHWRTTTRLVEKGKESGPSVALAISLAGPREWADLSPCGADNVSALRLRYNLPISLPPTASSSTLTPVPPALPRLPSQSLSPSPGHRALLLNPIEPAQTRRRGQKDEEVIKIDPAVIARKGQGWDKMLSKVLVEWVEAAARELRQEMSQ